MSTIFMISFFLQATPSAPSKAFDLGIWYALVVIASFAFIAFFAIKRISDIITKRKTDAMIREVGENDKPDNKEESVP